MEKMVLSLEKMDNVISVSKTFVIHKKILLLTFLNCTTEKRDKFNSKKDRRQLNNFSVWATNSLECRNMKFLEWFMLSDLLLLRFK